MIEQLVLYTKLISAKTDSENDWDWTGDSLDTSGDYSPDAEEENQNDRA